MERELVTGIGKLCPNFFDPKQYPTCVSSKLCEFIADVNDLNRSANDDQQWFKQDFLKSKTHTCVHVYTTHVHMCTYGTEIATDGERG